MVSSDEINRRLEAKRRGKIYREPVRRTADTPPAGGDINNSKECPSCHTQNPPTAKFCVGCGRKLEVPKVEAETEEGFSPEIKGPESEIKSADVEKPIKARSKITSRPDDVLTQRTPPTSEPIRAPEATEEKKLEPIVLTGEAETGTSKQARPEPISKPPEIKPKPTEAETISKRPKTETISKRPEPEIKKPPEVKTVAPTLKSSQSEKKVEASEVKAKVDPVERIKKAKELLDIGAITEEEYEMIKDKYLKEI